MAFPPANEEFVIQSPAESSLSISNFDGASGSPATKKTANRSRLQVAKASNVKHVPFDLKDGESGGKKNSNLIHADGELRSNMCAPCLAAIASFNMAYVVGRGNSSFNEYACCMTSEAYGNGGTQCGRCVGLGKGPECIDVPDDLQEAARKLIKTLPKFNQILKVHPTTPASELSTTQQATLKETVDLAVKFNNLFTGQKRRGQIAKPITPRKRTADVMMQGDLGDIGQTSKDTRSDLARVELTLTRLATTVETLVDSVSTANRLLRQNRARVKHLETMVSTLSGRAELGDQELEILDMEDGDNDSEASDGYFGQ